VEATAAKFINPVKEVNSTEEALAGARDIIAEWVSENAPFRARMRNVFLRNSSIKSKVIKGKEKEGEKYEIYFDSEESIAKAPSHRKLAMFRAENEGFLRLHIAPDEEESLTLMKRFFIKSANRASDEVWLACTDSYKRLLQPQMQSEMHKYYKEQADSDAINVFTANLRQLLLAPPLGQKIVMAIDPGFRTGCKVVVLDRQGKLLHHDTIYPHPPEQEYAVSSDKLKQLVKKYQVEAIAIGNGTAGRETERFVKAIPFEREVMTIMVNESGASIYSASEVAREEFPKHDITVRGSVSIGRRLMDPLAELVKIDPKSIGVGQYQHDVNQTRLQQSLLDVVESCVNYVGVEVNTASKELLSYVSGVGATLSKNIIDYRNANGPFKNRKELKNVARFGDKSYEQAAGFLRIHGAENPLDDTAVHPESYHIVDEMAKYLKCSVSDLIKDENLRKQLNPALFVTEKVGIPTLKDIMQELAKPGRDPRSHFEQFEFDKDINKIEDLKPGSVVPGIVTNITKFGCFVDIGVHQDGLVHISNITDKYITDLSKVIKLQQKVKVRILEVDVRKKRISLSMRNIDE
jgi:uncharacterized protein